MLILLRFIFAESLSGKYELYSGRFSIINPIIEDISKENLSTARIVPIYKETKNLNSNQIRKIINELFKLNFKLIDYLNSDIRNQFNLLEINAAYLNAHFPKNNEKLLAAKHRLSFNQLFKAILASELNKRELAKDKALIIKFNQELAKRFINDLPYKLSDEQRIATWQILRDISRPIPMNRLLEGEVGSGKTVVAAMASLLVVDKGYQVAFMAPTEILAKQHLDTISKMYSNLEHHSKIALLLGSTAPKEKRKIIEKIRNNEIGLIIGTHALISEKLIFKNLALVVIDEQHRFGVNQRKLLKQKANLMPHLLTLSATPIPRSLALTLFRELSISILKDKPVQSKPVSTKLLSEEMYLREVQNLNKILYRREQIIIVCPSINEKPGNHNSLMEVYQRALEQFSSYKVAFLHSKLPAVEKDSIMNRFIANDINVLVSTTVIEVGIDIPNLTAIVIMSAERFGLAQLHQIRGRVGRHRKPGTCYLVYSNSNSDNIRLKAILSAKNGIELAEYDLEQRGPGAIYGQLQHGKYGIDYKLINNKELLDNVRNGVDLFLQDDKNLIKSKDLINEVEHLRKIINLD